VIPTAPGVSPEQVLARNFFFDAAFTPANVPGGTAAVIVPDAFQNCQTTELSACQINKVGLQN
jgi:hypothetical protein